MTGHSATAKYSDFAGQAAAAVPVLRISGFQRRLKMHRSTLVVAAPCPSSSKPLQCCVCNPAARPEKIKAVLVATSRGSLKIYRLRSVLTLAQRSSAAGRGYTRDKQDSRRAVGPNDGRRGRQGSGGGRGNGPPTARQIAVEQVGLRAMPLHCCLAFWLCYLDALCFLSRGVQHNGSSENWISLTVVT